MNDFVQIGSRLGQYQIQAEIGRGGMGAVYKGYDPRLDRHVAVKVLAPHLVWQKDFVERFMREARAAARLRHPSIVHIYDVGQEGNWYYYVMEYLEGQTLTELIRQRGPMSAEEAIAILRPLAEALDYAHQNGLVHRDIKPSNVVVGRAGRVTLTDFGIARAAQETGLTATGTVVGTPEYISPEQTQGVGVDARSDQYSLAVVAYEMLGGHVPFKADSTLALMYKVVHEPPPPIRAVRRDLPVEVEGVLDKGLAKEPAKRYPTVSAFVEALAAALAGKKVRAVPAAAVVATGKAATPAPAAAGKAAAAVQPEAATAAGPAAAAPARAGPRRFPIVLLVAGLAVLLVLLLGGLLLNRCAGNGTPTAIVVVVTPGPVASLTTELQTGGGVLAPTVTLRSATAVVAPTGAAGGSAGTAGVGTEPVLGPTDTPAGPTGPAPSDTASAPTATLVPASATPTPVAAATRAPAKTPKPPPVPTKAPPTPVAAQYPAPVLVGPADGQAFTDRDTIVLEWQPVGPLAEDAYYQVVVRFAPVENPQETWEDETPWIKQTRWTLSEHNYLPALSADDKFRWSVRVMRQTGKNAQGKPTGTPLSPLSAERTLIWTSSGGGGGGGDGEPTSPPP